MTEPGGPETPIDAMIDLLPIPVLIQDGVRVIHANAHSVGLYGYASLEDFIGTPIIDLIHPDERDRFERRHTAVMSGDTIMGVIEQKRLRADGSEIYVLTRGIRTVWKGETCIMGIQVDLTERIRAERALALSEERFRLLFESAIVGLIGLSETGHCILANRAAADFLGFPSRDDLIGRSALTLFPEAPEAEGGDRIGRMLGRLIVRAETFETTDIVFHRVDGSSFPGAFRMTPMQLGDRLYGYQVSFCDISARRAARQKVQVAERAVRALHAELTHASQNEAMANLSTVIAHELRQPLSAIMNTAGAMRRSATPGALSTDAAERVTFIYDQAERASEIISGMRRLFTEDQHETRIEPVNPLIADACAVARMEFDRRDIELDMTFDDGLPPVRANRIQIQQVVYNLLRNAGEALAQSGEKRVRVDTGTDGAGGVRVRIGDSGPGLSDAIRERLFEAFATDKTDGMGMGLYTCRTIIEAHGGDIRAVSPETGGTTFEFTLPAAR